MQYDFEDIAQRSGYKVRMTPGYGLDLVSNTKTYEFPGDGISTHRMVHAHFRKQLGYNITWPRARSFTVGTLPAKEEFEKGLRVKAARKAPPSNTTYRWGGFYAADIDNVLTEEGVMKPELASAVRKGFFYINVECHRTDAEDLYEDLKKHLKEGDVDPECYRPIPLSGRRASVVIGRYPGADLDVVPPLSIMRAYVVELPAFVEDPQGEFEYEVPNREQSVPPPAPSFRFERRAESSSGSVMGDRPTEEDFERKWGEDGAKASVLLNKTQDEYLAVVNNNKRLGERATAARTANKKFCAKLLALFRDRVVGRDFEDLVPIAFEMATTVDVFYYLLRASASQLVFGSKLSICGADVEF